ncbi:MAG: metallophosphoesterase [Candidatus Methanomethylicaceae archaeon]
MSDAHLFQSFMKNYDPLYDFNIVLQKIKEKNNPDALLIAGDMFDFKKTASIYPALRRRRTYDEGAGGSKRIQNTYLRY